MGPLRERDVQIAALRQAMERARSGHGSVRILTGPAGVGKTALLRWAGREAREREMAVISARASELDRNFGFGVVHQLLEGIMRPPGPDPGAALLSVVGDVAADQHRVLDRLYRAVVGRRERGPAVVRVDDADGADGASLRFLEYLGRRIGELPLVLLVAAREITPDRGDGLLAAMAAADTAEVIRLGPLSPGAVEGVISDALGRPPAPPFVDAAVEATGGNPLLVTMLAGEAARRQMSGRPHEAGQVVQLGARSIAPVTRRMLGRVGADGLAVAECAAVVGDRVRFDDLVQLSGRSPEAVAAALAELVDTRVLGEDRRYVHPLVREAVAESIPRGRREHLHRQTAELLRRRAARPAEIALHRLAVPPRADAEAMADLAEAGRGAAHEGAIEAAIELLRRAADEGAHGAGRPEVVADLAILELRDFRPEGVERMCEALAGTLRRATRARCHAALGGALLLRDPAAALAEIDAARACADDPGLRLSIDALGLESLIFLDALTDRRRRRLDEIRQASVHSSVELAHLACEGAMSGAPAQRVREIGRLAAADPDLLRELGPTWNLLAHALRIAEAAEESRAVLEEARRVAHRRGLGGGDTFVDHAAAYWHRDFGSVAEGLAQAWNGYELARAGRVPVSVSAMGAILVELLLAADRADEALTIAEEIVAPVEGTMVGLLALCARGEARAAAGRPAAAERDLRRVVLLGDRRGWHAPGATGGRLRLAELLARRGRAEEARALAAADMATARAAGTPGASGAARRVWALTLAGEERLTAQREAVAVLEGTGRTVEHGVALADLGASLVAAGHPADARAVLRSALDAAVRSSCARLERVARDGLVAAGGRPRRTRVRGSEALTPRERRVAELAAQGLSNERIARTLWISRRTVEYHLGNAYTKLGIASRSQLPEALSSGPQTPG